ncbi:hypothetical protein JW935_25755, partial [candidate division KSB1 bacterium]|nr:hypothetical protein [candidate division KSB1 bacterium]
GQIDLVPVHREGEGPSINVRIKNFSDQDMFLQNLQLAESRQNKILFTKESITIPARQTINAATLDAAQSFGCYKYILSAVRDDQALQLDQVE